MVQKDKMEGKGRLNNQITSIIFEYLAHHGIASHFIATFGNGTIS